MVKAKAQKYCRDCNFATKWVIGSLCRCHLKQIDVYQYSLPCGNYDDSVVF